MQTCRHIATGALTLFLLCLAFPLTGVSQTVPVPQGITLPAAPASPGAIASRFLGIPYRNDGAVNERGQYTLFADQGRLFPTPGLNCSGLVLEASRFLLRKNFVLDDVVRDRLGDSGPGALHGEDWDFGWDLIMNISEGYSRRILLPGNAFADPSIATGLHPRGFDIHTEKTWKELPARLTPGKLYLASLSVEGHRKGYGLQHYHVGFIVVEDGSAWFYQTTGKGAKSNRRDLKSPKGIASFKKAFANTGANRKHMLLIEVDLPS